MPIYQSFNRKTKRWVKYKFSKNGFIPINVKQINPRIPFKGVRIKGIRPK